MISSISYTKYPGEQNTYNGGNFLSNDKVATAGCSGTTCNVLAANSVFSNGQGAPLASNQSGGGSRAYRSDDAFRSERLLQGFFKGGKSKKRRSHRRRHSRKMKGGRLEAATRSGGASKKRRHSRKMKGGRIHEQARSGGASKKRSHKRRHSRKLKGGARSMALKAGASKKRRSHKRRYSRKRRSHKRRHSRKMKGGMRSPPAIAAVFGQNGGGTQLMNNICHSSGYSIGPVGTELKPTEVGLAALHYAPYTNTQNNNFSNII